MNIGVLALQGAFIEHEKMLSTIGAPFFEIRQKTDLRKAFDGLILPGGESTAMLKLLHELDLFADLKSMIKNGLPVFGTCAGLILLAKHVLNDDREHFSTMDIEVVRNAYGRQLGSFRTEAQMKGIGQIPMTFIRAPYIESVGESVDVLATVENHIVAAKQGNQLAISFHPELNEDTSVHRFFLKMVAEAL
jgi:pyridoxal 5''-phosphate synthase, glutaminase subunit Pdx2